MNISVILCTYNRCGSLARALQSISIQDFPQSIEWEVLVIDNNSGDRTRDVVEEFCRQNPQRFRYMFEAQRGKSHALNTGIKEARGDVLAFVDDDVTVAPQWLQNLTAVLQDRDWIGCGGRILPDRNFSVPRWLELKESYARAPLVMFDLGPGAAELSEPPYGTNMAFRRSAFAKYGGFRTDLGPQPGSQIRSEDTEFGSRLLAAGERLRYEPSAVVYHMVAEERLQKQYFLTWWYDKARADIRSTGAPPDMKLSVAGIPLVLLRRSLVWTLRWIVDFKPSRRFASKVNVWTVAGRIVESYRLRSRAAKETHEETLEHCRSAASSK